MSSINNIIPPKYFVGLHAHDGSSVYDGLGYPNEHIDFILENGMDAFALTNHGNMNSSAHAHSYSKKLKQKGDGNQRNYRSKSAAAGFKQDQDRQRSHDQIGLVGR